MIKIGLTGGIGSGKSTISNIFKKKNIPVIDADIISREVLDIYPEIIEKIIDEFGSQFVDSNGKLKRRELGDYVFKDKRRKNQLESIIIPYIKKEIFNHIKMYDDMKKEICILDAPTLIENSLNLYMDFNILVWVKHDIQIERVKIRDNLKDEQVLDRINSQMSLDEKRNLVDFIIDNSFDLKNTKEQLEKVLASIVGHKEEQ